MLLSLFQLVGTNAGWRAVKNLLAAAPNCFGGNGGGFRLST